MSDINLIRYVFDKADFFTPDNSIYKLLSTNKVTLFHLRQ